MFEIILVALALGLGAMLSLQLALRPTRFEMCVVVGLGIILNLLLPGTAIYGPLILLWYVLAGLTFGYLVFGERK